MSSDGTAYANQHLWEWWLNDYVNTTVTIHPRGDREVHTQKIIDDWGAYRRKMLSWAEKMNDIEVKYKEKQNGP